MNGIYVVDTNDALCEEAYASISAAAARWFGVELVVVSLTESELHPACWKLLAFEFPGLAASEYERLMILDADTVISAQAPNPFDLFPEDKLTVVTDRQTHQPARDKAEADEWRIVTVLERPSNYFNTGMMIASRAHQPLFELAYGLCEQYPSLSWHDQTPLNVVMSQHQHLLNYTDQSWNFHNPNKRLPNWQNMAETKQNIYHFPGNPDRLKLISEVQWA